MKVVLDLMLEKKERSLYWLAEKTGVAYPNLHNFMKNKTALVKFDTLEKICLVLDCTPNDILQLEKDID